LLIPDPDPTIALSRIPDPGGKKAPDPGFLFITGIVINSQHVPVPVPVLGCFFL
jgi:hypothetical protein